MEPAYMDQEYPDHVGLDQGYIFVAGKYIAPPYELRLKGLLLFINNRTFELSAFGEGAKATQRPARCQAIAACLPQRPPCNGKSSQQRVRA